MFGDSSYIVGYLQAIGYDLSRVEQTGSNFGTAVAHDTPFLCTVGSGTVVADGLTFVNADYSSTSFRVSRVSIGAHNFLGNDIFYPAQGRTGDDCLLATKVMVPIDGPIREGVGLLGSPSFEIPRTTERDSRLALEPRRAAPRAGRQEPAQPGHHRAAAADAVDLHLAGHRVRAGRAGPLLRVRRRGDRGDERRNPAAHLRLLRAARPHRAGPAGAAAAGLLDLRPRASGGTSATGRSAPTPTSSVFNGTPFKSVVWRLLGVRVGHRLFDDGCFMTERSFVTIGDHCTFNAGSVIQCHSQENDAFKSDRVEVGSGVTVGVGGFVHYGVRLGDGAVLEADSFLMKGEEVPPRTRWAGNPAMEMEELDEPAGPRPGRPPDNSKSNQGDTAMDMLVESGREYWRGVLGAGGFTAIPRWTRDPAPSVAEHREPIPADVAAALHRLADSSALIAVSSSMTSTPAAASPLTAALDGGRPAPCTARAGSTQPRDRPRPPHCRRRPIYPSKTLPNTATCYRHA